MQNLFSQHYIPAKSELTTTLQSVTRSHFFLDYNFNYTNVSNFLIWHKTDFATLTTDEIKTLKAKMLKLPTMSMDIFKNVLGNIDKNYPFSMSPKLILALLVLTGVCTIVIGILFIWYKKNYQNRHLHKILKMLLPLSLFLNYCKFHLMNLFYHLYWYQSYNWKNH